MSPNVTWIGLPQGMQQEYPNVFRTVRVFALNDLTAAPDAVIASIVDPGSDAPVSGMCLEYSTKDGIAFFEMDEGRWTFALSTGGRRLTPYEANLAEGDWQLCIVRLAINWVHVAVLAIPSNDTHAEPVVIPMRGNGVHGQPMIFARYLQMLHEAILSM